MNEKVAISIDGDLLKRLDGLVQARVFRSRSQAIAAAVQEKLSRLEKTRLAIECSKLDVEEERALADQGLHSEMSQWPEY